MQISLLSVILLAAAVIVGPVGAGLGWGACHRHRGQAPPLTVRLFNMAMISSIGSVGGLAYLLAGGSESVSHLNGPAPIIIGVGCL